jgi:hypothetical protein
MSGILDMPSPGPTARLARVRDLLRRARLAERMMKQGETGDERDRGTVLYVGTVDAVVAELAELENIGALGELERFATVSWGRP